MKPTSSQSRALTVVAVVALVLAFFTLDNAGDAVSSVQQGFAPARGPEIFVAYQEAFGEHAKLLLPRWGGWLKASGVMSALASVLLGTGGVLGLLRREPGRGLLIIALVFAAFTDVVGLVPAVGIQIDMVAPVHDVSGTAVAAVGAEPAAPLFRAAAQKYVSAWLIFVIAVLGAIAVAKLAFYAWGLTVLRRAAIRRLFAERPARALGCQSKSLLASRS